MVNYNTFFTKKQTLFLGRLSVYEDTIGKPQQGYYTTIQSMCCPSPNFASPNCILGTGGRINIRTFPLFQHSHAARMHEIANLQFIDIHPRRHQVASFIPTIPDHRINARFLSFVNQNSHQLSE